MASRGRWWCWWLAGVVSCGTASRLCEGHVALRNTQRFKTSVVCSGSRVTNSTVLKLHESDNRGGIVVKLTQRALAHINIVPPMSRLVFMANNLKQ